MGENRDHLGRRLRPCVGRVRMADNTTIVGVYERFRATASLNVPTGQVVCSVAGFWMWGMTEAESVGAIIGLPGVLAASLVSSYLC